MDIVHSDQHNHIWLRCETKKHERRTPLTPEDARSLVERNHHLHVESSPDRIFKDEEYRKAGCAIEPAYSWPNAPLGAYILGLKELPEGTSPIKHSHIYFAHAYKNKNGANAILRRFINGNGTIYDLEYLQGNGGSRVVAFGKWAGFVGATLGLDIFCHQQKEPSKAYPSIVSSFNSTQLIDLLSDRISHLKDAPRIIVIGAKGRSGQGALELLSSLNLEATEWDLNETKAGGPFNEILDYNILINCVLVRERIPPFLTLKMLELPARKLSVIADVSCDTGNLNSPLPFYNTSTTFEHPTHHLTLGTLPLDVMAIDHLPSLLPTESSIDFSRQLLPYLTDLLESKEMPKVWKTAKSFFTKNIQLI